MNNEERLSLYKQSLRSAWGYNDYNDWPIKINSVMHLFLEKFSQEFLEDLEQLRFKGVSNKEIGDSFGNPARLYRIIDPIIFGMKRKCVPLSRQREIVISLLDIVKSMKHGSEFNENGCNVILNPKELSEVIKIKNFKVANKEDSKLLHKFCGIMWAYTEAIFFRAHDVTKEIHGLYANPEISGNLLVREYLHLCPKEIWGNIDFIPYKNIRIYTIYNNNIKLNIDSYDHLFHCGGSYIDDLISYAIEVDGKYFDLSDVSSLISQMGNVISSIHSWVNQNNWKAIVNRYADIYWYRKKPLREILGIDWTVPVEVRESIENGSANEKRLKNLTDEQIDRLINIVI